MPTCPNGHQSGSDDWCEVCGHRMTGAVPPPPPPPPAPDLRGFPAGPGAPQSGRPELCPQCHTPREGGAPFCEECRWNFLTNTATSYTPAAPPQSGPPSPPPGFQRPPGDPYEPQGSRPSQINRPAEPLPASFFEPSSQPAPPPQGGPQNPPGPPGPGAPQGGGPVPPQGPLPVPPRGPGPQAPPPAPTNGGAPQPFQQQPAPQPSFGRGEAVAPPRPGGDDWVISPPSTPGPPAPPPAGSPGGPVAPPGFDRSETPPPTGGYAPPAVWTATIGPDREYFMAMMHRSGPEATGLNLPAYSPEQQRQLQGPQVSIGRRRHSTGDTPDIDLSVPPEDPGVSHQHALLVAQPDGSWAVVDQNSTNGTTVNGAEEPIQPFVPVPLQDGDRVHVGAWTTITVRRG
ncbi:FHA domain-containing protein [Streptomyces sp. NPDC050560]|uniref:FHA domain-containing protein n=1 Tax=Streptomyces sp. NPDC050560 TaxID=3365630 RepID=UPI0037ADAEFB